MFDEISNLSHLQEQLATITDSQLQSVFNYINTNISPNYLDLVIRLISKYSQIRLKYTLKYAKILKLILEYNRDTALPLIFKFAEPHLLRNLYNIDGFTLEDLDPVEKTDNIIVAFAPEYDWITRLQKILYKVPYNRLLELQENDWQKYIEILLNRYENDSAISFILKDDVNGLKNAKDIKKYYYLDEISYENTVRTSILAIAKYYEAKNCYDYLVSKGMTPDDNVLECTVLAGRLELLEEPNIIKFSKLAIEYHHNHDLVVPKATLEDCVRTQNYVLFLQKIATDKEISDKCMEIACVERNTAFVELFKEMKIDIPKDYLEFYNRVQIPISGTPSAILGYSGKTLAQPFSSEVPNPANNRCCRILLIVCLILLVFFIGILVYLMQYAKYVDLADIFSWLR